MDHPSLVGIGGSTIPAAQETAILEPSSRREAEPDTQTYLTIRPISTPAKREIHAVRKFMRNDTAYAEQARKFIHPPVHTEQQLVEEDENATDDVVYKISLDHDHWPRVTQRGWVLGSAVDKLIFKAGASNLYLRAAQAREQNFDTILGSRLLYAPDDQLILHQATVTIGTLLYQFEFNEGLPANISNAQVSELQRSLGWPTATPLEAVTPTSGNAPITLVGMFRIGAELYKGTFGSVGFGQHVRTGEYVAAKKIRMTAKTQAVIQRELQMLKSLNYANVVHIADDFDDSLINMPLMTSEATVYLMTGRPTSLTLDQAGTQLVRNSSAFYIIASNICAGLHYLKNKGCIHSDVKPRNIGVSFEPQPYAKLLDLGHCTWDSTSRDHNRGTIPYLAPEVITLKSASRDSIDLNTMRPFTAAVDVWGAGLSLAECLLQKGRLSAAWSRDGITRDAYDHALMPMLQSCVVGDELKLLKACTMRMLEWDQDLRPAAHTIHSDLSCNVGDADKSPPDVAPETPTAENSLQAE